MALPPTTKILILKPSSLGDVIQALPVLRLLRKRHPDSEIYWWLNSDFIPLLEGDLDLTGVIPFERKGWGSPRRWQALLATILEFRRKRFDTVIDLQSLARSASIAWLARGKLTIGLDDSREGAPSFYDIAVPRPSYETHAVDWYLETLKHLDTPVTWDFDWLPERPSVAASLRARWPDGPFQWVLLQPGARWANKRWPVARFAELIRNVAASSPAVRFVVMGGTDDHELGEQLTQAAPQHTLNLAGKTTLPEMIEWVRRCAVMVTNDTGPMHVAAALRKPVVALFGPTDAHRTGPYGQLQNVLRAKLPCAPCMTSVCHWHNPLECLQLITESDARKALLRHLSF